MYTYIYVYIFNPVPIPIHGNARLFQDLKSWKGGECARIILFYDILCVWGYVGKFYLYIPQGIG